MRALIAVALSLALALAGCQSSDTGAPAAGAVDVAEALADAAESDAASHPWCDLATFAEVSAVVGGNIAKHDVIAGEGMDSVDCVYLDPNDPYNGLTIRFINSDLLRKNGSQWSSATAYVDEWGRSGAAVAGVGDRAIWVDLPESLLVLRGDYVLRFSAGRANVNDAATRTRFETLAGQVVARLP